MIVAAADGSSLSNPGPAGWAWYVDDAHWASGGWPRGTNNMAELMAVLDLLQQTEPARDEPLKVFCDSQYVINSLTQWMPGWKRRGWRKADGKPVLNVELLQQLDLALAGRTVSFEWVKGHAGHELNEAADERARAAATAYQNGSEVPVGPGWAGESSSAREQVFAVSTPPEPEPDLFSHARVEPNDPEPNDAGPVGSSLDADQVIALEKELLDDAVRADRVRLTELLHPEFVEHGQSGSILTRRRAVLGLPALTLTPRVDVLGVDQIAEGVLALRYRLELGSRTSLRFSLWQRTQAGWQLRFHQGTPTAAR